MRKLTNSQTESDATTRECKRIREQTYSDAEREINEYNKRMEKPGYFDGDSRTGFHVDHKPKRCTNCGFANYNKNLFCNECGIKF